MAPSRFRSREGVLASADDRVVQLKFTKLKDEQGLICLYAHPCVLSTWSRVLASVIEDAQQSQPAEVAASASSGVVLRQQTIPLDDPDTAAWEDALSLMYPSVPLFEINWSNAARLLLLADKYDMPCLTEHIKAFLNAPQQAFAIPTAGTPPADDDDNPHATAGPTRLQAHLSDGSWPNLPDVFEWLQVTSKCGLDQHAVICIQHIVNKRLQIPPGVISSVRAEHAEQLLWRLQEALQAAARPLSGFVCCDCGSQWYWRGNEDESAYACLHCGCTHCEREQVEEGVETDETDDESDDFDGESGDEDGSSDEEEDESSNDDDD